MIIPAHDKLNKMAPPLSESSEPNIIRFVYFRHMPMNQRYSIAGKNLGPPYPCAIMLWMSMFAFGQGAHNLIRMNLPDLVLGVSQRTDR
jgi:hypothetical protein